MVICTICSYFLIYLYLIQSPPSGFVFVVFGLQCNVKMVLPPFQFVCLMFFYNPFKKERLLFDNSYISTSHDMFKTTRLKDILVHSTYEFKPQDSSPLYFLNFVPRRNQANKLKQREYLSNIM